MMSDGDEDAATAAAAAADAARAHSPDILTVVAHHRDPVAARPQAKVAAAAVASDAAAEGTRFEAQPLNAEDTTG